MLKHLRKEEFNTIISKLLHQSPRRKLDFIKVGRKIVKSINFEEKNLEYYVNLCQLLKKHITNCLIHLKHYQLNSEITKGNPLDAEFQILIQIDGEQNVALQIENIDSDSDSDSDANEESDDAPSNTDDEDAIQKGFQKVVKTATESISSSKNIPLAVSRLSDSDSEPEEGGRKEKSVPLSSASDYESECRTKLDRVPKRTTEKNTREARSSSVSDCEVEECGSEPDKDQKRWKKHGTRKSSPEASFSDSNKKNSSHPISASGSECWSESEGKKGEKRKKNGSPQIPNKKKHKSSFPPVRSEDKKEEDQVSKFLNLIQQPSSSSSPSAENKFRQRYLIPLYAQNRSKYPILLEDFDKLSLLNNSLCESLPKVENWLTKMHAKKQNLKKKMCKSHRYYRQKHSKIK
ncbi:clumping factor A-like [Lineus longissimus]|uniref:clumping factor A-like n=1 Tax=Lineus longissimus TaxID=88925 RepID=UPI00315D0BD5